MAKGKTTTKTAAQMTVSELYEALYSTKKELFALKLQKGTGQLKQPHLIRNQRRQFARLLTQRQQLKLQGKR